MPVFIAFAAFLLFVFGHRLGLPIAPWVVTTGPFGNKRKTPDRNRGYAPKPSKWCWTTIAVVWRGVVSMVDSPAETCPH